MSRSYYRLRGLAPTMFRILQQTLLEKDGHGVIHQTDNLLAIVILVFQIAIKIVKDAEGED